MTTLVSWHGGSWSSIVLIETRAAGAQWSDIFRRTAPPNAAGAYRLIAMDVELHIPMAISRVCGIDWTGTLYLGASLKLENRINSLVRTYSNDLNGGGHTPVAQILSEKYPSRLLGVSWRLVDEGLSPFELEYELMGLYVNEHGEPPPMNGYGRYPAAERSSNVNALIMRDAVEA